MIFNKTMAYNIDPLSLPRLYPYETYNTYDVLVRKINENTGVIRFSNIVDFARNQNINLLEAGKTICGYHGLENYITIINEEKFYLNNSYRQAVLESFQHIPMQLEKASYNVPFSILLEYCVEMDIKNNTYYTDLLLEDISSGSNNLNNESSNDQKSEQGLFSGLKDSFTNKVTSGLKWLGGKVIGNYLDNNSEEVSEKVGQAAPKVANRIVDNIASGVKDTVSYAKGAMVTAAAGSMLALLNNTVNNLTNGENINSDNPGIIKRTLNSLKGCMNQLLGKQQNAPQNQQGIISRLINKVKSAMSYLGKKIGISSEA